MPSLRCPFPGCGYATEEALGEVAAVAVFNAHIAMHTMGQGGSGANNLGANTMQYHTMGQGGSGANNLGANTMQYHTMGHGGSAADHLGANTKQSQRNSPSDGLKAMAFNTFSIPHDNKEGLEIRKINMKLEHSDKKHKVQKLYLGSPTNKPHKVILLVGATGSGKTTLINNMVNFIFGVDFNDDFRFILIDDKGAPKKSQAESQTDLITAYVFYNITGMPFDYSYVLIDTPGYGDTRGIQRDREMMSQLEMFLKQSYGIDSVDAVGFVTPSSSARLTQTQKYVYEGLSSMFGKDIKNNIFVIATFADASIPPVLDALKEAKVGYSGFYKFNNSALYGRNKGDEDDTLLGNTLYWEMAFRNMNNFFKQLGQTNPASLTLTKEVLSERSKLQIIVAGLQNQITYGLGKLSTLQQELDILNRINDDIKGSENYEEEVDVPKFEKIDLNPGEHVTNCIPCNMTCHYPCYIPDDSDKMNCWAMTDEFCRVCPQNCKWDEHRNMNFRYEHYTVKEKRQVKELYDRYSNANQGKVSKEQAVNAIENDINKSASDLLQQIQQAQQHVARLDKIALKPNPLSTKEYIELMIESEKMQKAPNFDKRINILEGIKNEVAVLQGIQGKPKQSGAELYKYFRNLIMK